MAVKSCFGDGVIELEFHADLIRPSAPIRVTSAKLFGVSHESADVLRLASQPLRTSRLPIRARSTKESSPVDVSIARDEAGNVRYIDESGAVGMPTPWLAQRGGDAKSSVAAKRAATKLIEQLASSSLHQLGVNLETDDE